MAIKKQKRKSVLIRVGVIAFACYILFTLVSLKIEIERSKKEVQELNNQIEDQEIINEELEKTLSDDNLDDAIRRAAEEQGYTAQGEEIYIDAAGN